MTTRYTLSQRLLHWTMAVLIAGVLSGGLLIWVLGFQGVTDLLGASGRDALYELHKTFGLVLLVLVLWRIALRVRNGAPPYAAPLPERQRRASGAVHLGLYASMVAMPLLGWLATDVSDYPVEFFAYDLPQILPKNAALGRALYTAHGICGLALLGLSALHIGAALRHRLVERDGVFERMTLG